MTSLLDNTEIIEDQIDETKDYFAELVGENKKFKTPQELAKGKAISDSYIKTLEKRSDDLRNDYLRLKNDYESRAKLEEIVDKLSQKQQSSSNENTTENDADKGKPTLDLNEIESLITRKITEGELTKRQEENFRIVKNKLQERFGNNYTNVLKKQVEDLRLSDEDVNSLARKSPDAFFKLMGLDQPEQKDTFQSPPKSNRRSDNFSPTVQKRTWSYYQNLRKENPTLYHDPKIAVQMHNDAIALGKEFEDGDFNS